MKRINGLVLSVVTASLLSACENSDQSTLTTPAASDTAESPDYSAEIRWTEYGIPHVKADSWADLGFGYAYAVATNGICVLAEEYATVKGERARYFGASDENIHSDAFHRALLNDDKVADYQAATSEASAAMDRGYAAGYNHFIEKNGNDLPERCAGEPWVKPIEVGDLARLTIGVSIRYGLGRVAEAIVTASPNRSEDELAARLEPVPASMGSNALAFGSELSESGRGLLLGNPHYPWHGGSRFHIAHLTVPGEMDVMGAGLLTTPRLGIGFTDDIAWTHTVSTALRFTLFRLDLAEDDPMRYMVGEESRPIEAIEVAVDTDDGEETRTVYMTHLGPVLSTEDAAWSDEHVYVMRDVNYENYRAGDLYKAIPQSGNVEELRQALGDYQGAAFVNTIAADRQGGALYADMSAIPNTSAALIERCSTGPDRVNGQRVIVLNGSDPSCNWQVDESAAAPGLMPPSEMPSLITDTFVSNSNDSHWLSNPDQPLEGFSPIIGDEGTQRTLRTRAGLHFVEEVIQGEGKFTQPIVQNILFSQRNFGAELFLDDVLKVCADDEELAQACQILSNWDRQQKVDSVGAQIYTEFWLAAMEGIDEHYAVPFDPEQPLDTPRGLTIDQPETREHLLSAMREGVNKLTEAGTPLDARWGDAQYAVRNGEKIGVPGGLAETGMYSMIIPEFDEEAGAYNRIVHGNSYIQVVTWDENGQPDVKAILTYSQSPEPDSPNYADMTRLYEKGQWVDLPFSDEEIEAQLVRTETVSR